LTIDEMIFQSSYTLCCKCWRLDMVRYHFAYVIEDFARLWKQTVGHWFIHWKPYWKWLVLCLVLQCYMLNKGWKG